MSSIQKYIFANRSASKLQLFKLCLYIFQMFIVIYYSRWHKITEKNKTKPIPYRVQCQYKKEPFFLYSHFTSTFSPLSSNFTPANSPCTTVLSTASSFARPGLRACCVLFLKHRHQNWRRWLFLFIRRLILQQKLIVSEVVLCPVKGILSWGKLMKACRPLRMSQNPFNNLVYSICPYINHYHTHIKSSRCFRATSHEQHVWP